MNDPIRLIPKLSPLPIRLAAAWLCMAAIALSFTISPAKAQSRPSFSCSLAGTASERTICKNADLTKKDSYLGSVYQRLVSGEPDAGTRTVRREQRKWVLLRNRCGQDVDCLHASYDQRIADMTRLTGLPVFSDFYAKLLGHRFVSRQFTDQFALSLSERQIAAEIELATRYTPGNSVRANVPLRRANPLFYSWQKTIETGNGEQRNHYANIYLEPSAPWEFVPAIENSRAAGSVFVDVMVFEPELIADRAPRFAARENLSAVVDHFSYVSARAPTAFSGTVQIGPLQYDFDTRSFKPRPRAGLQERQRIKLLQSFPDQKSGAPVDGYFMYAPVQFPTPQLRSLRPGLQTTDSAVSSWRKNIQDLSPGWYFGFDRELVLDELQFGPRLSERIEAQLVNGRGLSARLNFEIVGGQQLDSSARPKTRLASRLISVDIMLGKSEILASLGPDAFRSVDDYTSDLAEAANQETIRNRIVPPLISNPGNVVSFTAENRDLFAVKFGADNLEDRRVEQLMYVRWQYEKELMRTNQRPDWGEIFVRREGGKPELRPMPQGAELTKAIPVFRKWIRDRAQTLPNDIELLVPIRAQKTNYFPRALLGQRTDVSSCNRNASVRERNSGSELAGKFKQICGFLEALEQVPAFSFPCLSRAGFGNLYWNCDQDQTYLISYERAARESGIKSEPTVDLLIFEEVVNIPDAALERIQGNQNALRIRATINDLGTVQDRLPSVKEDGSKAAENAIRILSGDEEPTTENSQQQPYSRIQIKLQSAELVDRRSGVVLASLNIEPHPGLPLDLLPKIEPEIAQPRSLLPAGRDILEVQIGMSFDEADQKIRNSMDVGSTLYADRKWSWNGIAGDLKPFTSGRMYLSRDGSQVIAIYDEPPGKKGVVLGMTRQLLVPQDLARTGDILAQLEGLYGVPSLELESSFGYRPEPNPYWVDTPEEPIRKRGPWGTGSMSCDAASYWNFNLGDIWKNEDGSANSTFSGNGRYSRLPEFSYDGSKPSSLCNNALTATVDPQTFPGFNALNLWLYDLNHYHDAYASSLESHRSGTANKSDEKSSALTNLLLGRTDAKVSEDVLASPANDALPDQPAPTISPERQVGAVNFERQIVSGADDVEQSSTGQMSLDSSDLELVDDPGHNGLSQMVGLRFVDVNIPRDATIFSARIRFTSEGSAKTAPTLLTFTVMANPNVPPFSATPANVASRPMGPRNVTWQPEPWPEADVVYRTPDLAPLVQEVVSRSDWQAGNAMGFMIVGTGERSAYSYDGNPGRAAVLEIEYADPGQTLSAQ